MATARFLVGTKLDVAKEIVSHEGIVIGIGERVSVYFSAAAAFDAGWMLGVETEDGRQALGLNIEESSFCAPV